MHGPHSAGGVTAISAENNGKSDDVEDTNTSNRGDNFMPCHKDEKLCISLIRYIFIQFSQAAAITAQNGVTDWQLQWRRGVNYWKELNF
jgi:hypothetical protein